MKKITAILLCDVMVLSALALVGCGASEETLKLGLGVYSTVEKATNADGNTNGQAQAVVTAAAVFVDAEGKIVAATNETVEVDFTFDTTGKSTFDTSKAINGKRELGDAYGMKSSYGSKKEWYEHADAFVAACIGKKASEVKALVAEDGKNSDALVSAGCTIGSSEFVKAVVAAVANAKDSAATKSTTLKLGINTDQKTSDATADKAGSNKLTTDIFAAAVDAEGKIVAATNETVEVDFTFDTTGKSTFDTSKAINGKRELGDAYGMKSSYGSKKEWYEHADAFFAACIGKKASEVASLEGNTDLQNAGCTIAIGGFVKAATKIG